MVIGPFVGLSFARHMLFRELFIFTVVTVFMGLSGVPVYKDTRA